MLSDLPSFALIDWLSAYERNARFPLSSSYTEPLSLRALLELAGEAEWDAALDEPLHYPPHRGFPELRDAIASTYAGLAARHVVAFAGADEALFVAFHTLLAAGERTIVPVPCYQSLEAVPRSIGTVDVLPLDPANGGAIDPDRIARLIRGDTRVLVLSLPGNPIGGLPSRAELDAIVALCRRHGIWLIADEVYRGTERDPARRLPQVAELYERAVSINVLSKALGLPGLRVGWAVSQDEALLARMARAKQYLSVCNASVSERLAAIALRCRDTVLARTRGIAEANLALLDRFMADHAERFEWRRPDGGVVAFPRLRGSVQAEPFALSLLQATGVLVVPGSVYRSVDGTVFPQHFRLGFGRSGFAPGLEAFARFLAD